MKVAEILRDSQIDFPGKNTLVVFTPGCNFRCRACHNREIVEGKGRYDEVFSYVDEWTDAVVITGGEPTIHPDLPEFCREIKSRFQNKPIKLDTNGSNPEVLASLLEKNLVDYIALDVKGPPALYRKIIGGNERFDLRDGIEKAIGIAQNFPDYEFRTTIAPVVRDNGEISFMTIEEVENMAEWVKGFVPDTESKWYLQPFVSRGKEEMMDERFSKENLPEEFRRTPAHLLEKYKQEIGKYFPNTEIRGED